VIGPWITVVVSAHDPFADRLMASQGTSSGHLLIAMSACAQRLLRQITVVPRTRDAERGMRSALVKRVGKIGRACVGNMFGRTRYDHTNQDDEMTSKPRFQLSPRGGHRLGTGGKPGGRNKAISERELLRGRWDSSGEDRVVADRRDAGAHAG
jgi:hypothetical protein